MKPAALLVISPHPDDAVLSCGQLIAARPQARVATLFAGVPADFAGATEQDAAYGFTDSRQALRKRRTEDVRALKCLGAHGEYLDFCDAQFGVEHTAEEIAPAIQALLERWRPSLFAFPLGLFHSDHVLAREATLLALARSSWLPASVLAYEDAPYRRMPGVVDDALAALRSACVMPIRCCGGSDLVALRHKSTAIACYASRLRGPCMPPGYTHALAPERYWRLALQAAARAA